MKPSLKIICLLLLLSSCVDKEKKTDTQAERFTKELLELKEYFKIPGLAVYIGKRGEIGYQNYFGVSNLKDSIGLNATHLFPIASLTKIFSGAVLMKLVEQQKLSLDEPIDKFLPKPIYGDSILVKHVLSHTSQGDVGDHFYYSSRFGLLTDVIERASGKSFSKAIEEEILVPLQLKNTFLLKDSTQIAGMAKPYMLDNGIEDGFIDYGYSASAGMVSNLQDLVIFSEALDANKIISNQSKDLMFSPFTEGSPYGYGIFSQQFEGLDMVWAYGQYDCYSSLLLKIPSEGTTLIVLANNNLLSDPARLIYGDATTSLFVLSFLKNYIGASKEMPLFEKPDSISAHYSDTPFYRKKILAQALAESYMARFETEKLYTSAKLLKHIFSAHPNYLEYADLSLLHNLSFLKDVAFYRELGEFNDFDVHIERIGKMLLDKDPKNPYVHSYLGTFHARRGDMEKAKHHFESIVNAKNFSKNWYTTAARNWLDENN